jgi:hypothetical protein
MQSKSGIIIYPQLGERERDGHSLNVDTTTLNISAWFSCHIIPPTSRTCESLYYLHVTTMSLPNNGFEIWTMYSVWVCFVYNNDASLTIRPCQTIQHLVKACVVSYLERTFRPWLMFRNGSLIYLDESWLICLRCIYYRLLFSDEWDDMMRSWNLGEVIWAYFESIFLHLPGKTKENEGIYDHDIWCIDFVTTASLQGCW